MSTEAPAAAIESPVAEETLSKEQQALKLTKRYSLWAAGGGLIPIIGLDIVAIIAAQVKLVRELTKVYGVDFKEERAKTIVTSLISGLGIVPIGTGILFSVVKILPLVGPLAATVALPTAAGAVTYATGKIFIKHFEKGGSLLDFKAEKVKAAYKTLFEEGKEKVAEANESAS